MIRSALRLAIAVAALAASQAYASVTTVTFTGTVTNPYNAGGDLNPEVGETITGTFTISSTFGLPVYSTDGSTYASGASYDAGVTWGSASFSGGSSLSFDSTVAGSAGKSINRDYGGYGFNLVENTAAGYSTNNSGNWYVLDVLGSDYNGAASTLFTDPNGGVQLDQPVDFTNASLLGYYEEDDGSGASSYGWFSISSLTITVVPEPGNLALMLAGVGLVGLRARRRRLAA